MQQPDRRPNWEKWRHVPYLKPWEAVALSLDIDPGHVRINEHSWMVDRLLFNEAKDFQDREEIAKRNLGVSLKSTFHGIAMAEFAAWALSIGWKTPKEFAALAIDSKSEAKTAVDPDALEGKGRSSALKLILGMALGGYGYDPTAAKSGTVREICDDLHLHGIELSDDAVRRWLTEAAAQVEWQKPDKADRK